MKKLLILILLVFLTTTFLFADERLTSSGFDFPMGNADDCSPYTISQKFQEDDPKLYYLPGHLGDDWRCKVGTEVLSISEGKVIFAGYGGKGWGNIVIVEHILPSREIIYSQYAHLSSIKVLVGHIVKRREIIGLSGNMGTGPHLHFEIKKINDVGSGYSIDPKVIAQYHDPSKFIRNNRDYEFNLVSEYPTGGSDKVDERITASVRFDLDIHPDCIDNIESYVTVKRLGWDWPREESYKIWAKEKKIYVLCNQNWNYKSKYEIFVNKGIKSKSGVELKKDFSYSYTIRKKPPFDISKWVCTQILNFIKWLYGLVEELLKTSPF